MRRMTQEISKEMIAEHPKINIDSHAEVECEKLITTVKSVSIKIGVEYGYLEAMTDPKNWPSDTMVDRYFCDVSVRGCRRISQETKGKSAVNQV